MDPTEITTTYQNNAPLYEALMGEVIFEITEALNEADVKYHSVTGRIKKLISLISKVESKEVSDPFAEVPDIVGARVVALFLSDIDKIIKTLQSCFDVELVDNKIEDSDPRLFGYFSVHMHARIKQDYAGTRYNRIKAFKFEVQIRTIAMDAWASASHYLSYKSEADVPQDLKRDFNALSGLYYVADKHFEMFFRSRAANLKRIDRAFKTHTSPASGALDLDILTAFLRDRYPDRRQPKGSEAAILLGEIRGKGITDLGVLIARLDEKQDAFLAHEKAEPPIIGGLKIDSVGRPPRFAAVGVVRVTLGL